MPDQPFFYSPIDVKSGEEFLVDSEEFDHIVKSLRMSVGDSVEFVNGAGMVIHSIITQIKNDELACRAESVEPSQNELPLHVTAAVGLIRRQRFEWMVEKLTELGVHSIQPIHSEHVVRSGLRDDRLHRKAIAAMKQSKRAVLPQIDTPRSFQDWLQTTTPEKTFVAAQTSNGGRLTSVRDYLIGDVAYAVGPEGGWSDAELEMLRQRGVRTFSLGERRLRTETAAVAILADRKSVV